WRMQDLNKILTKNEKNNPSSKIRVLINYLENDQILSIMEYMAKDFIHHKRGFPDIIVWNSEELFFVEVKSKGDTLTKKQTRVHKIMLNLGIDVRLFTINLSKRYASHQLEKYIHEDKATKSQYYERYKEKIEIANREYEILENNESSENVERYKRSLLLKGNDYFIAYLIILNDLGIKRLNDINQYKEEIDELICDKEKVIEKLRIIGKGKKLEDKKMFDEAIEAYGQLETYPHKYEAYRRVCICLRKKKDYYNEIILLDKLVNDESIPKYHYRFFKRRLEKLIQRHPQYDYLINDYD
ncbi:MAG: VRR-NUC domain-containing protein, partial [Methanobrevibacter sp.]|nr:VRR-NUC domain-containing protein [Methanobrevibacter sp.]